MYKYLLWDIDGTVLDFKAAEKQAIIHLFEKFGFCTCTDEMVSMYSAINLGYWEMLERGEIEKQTMLVARFYDFFEKVGADVTRAEEFNECYQQALGDYIVFVEDALEVLQAQKGKYVLAAVTNGTKIAQQKKLRMSGLDRIFDYIFISEDVGAEKPLVEYFDFVFDKIGLIDRKDALIIGDSLTSDIKGGIAAGIDTCWFNPKGTANKYNYDITYEVRSLKEIPELIE